ncbi:MAG: radical SAM family heme chaperone HemW [Rhodocyclaceae bacterium]|nr:radical SAM family heme chaperone HemW [Rhodocyclaceae bacterium]
MPRPIIPILPAGKPAVPSGLASPPPLSLYIHFPWCVRKCPYCDFNSHEAKGGLPEADYLSALIADLEQALPRIWGRRVSTIFIGGGTPSLMAPETVDGLLAAIRARLNLQADAEITLEANPGTVELDRFKGYRDAGVNRLSLGIQSFDDEKLKALGRIHDGSEARRAIEAAQQHFDNLNLDLMYALPRQTLDGARRDLETAIAFGTPHLSAYHLTLEPNTRFAVTPPPLPDADLAADMQDMVEETLAAAGFTHYETSAFARPGKECRHNLNYWHFGDYLGIGAGAHGKISDAFSIVRETRARQPQAYMAAAAAGNPVQERRQVAAKELPFEFLMNALRLTGGFAPTLFLERTGLSLETVRRELAEAENRGLLAVGVDRIAPTDLGRRFLNDLLEVFL